MLAALLALTFAATPAPLDADAERIQQRLLLVEELLRARPVPALTPAQASARRRGLDALRAYAQAGDFPHNTRHPGVRMPYFIDHRGTPCAVGQLIIASGHRALAERIARADNHVFLDAIGDDRELGAWIAASGFALDELALIQPSYPHRATQNAVAAEDRVALLEGRSQPTQSALLFAVQSGKTELVTWMLSRGASPTAGAMPFVYDDADAPRFGRFKSPLTVASFRFLEPSRPMDGVVAALVRAGADVDELIQQRSLLYAAAYSGNVAAVEFLLGLGARPDAVACAGGCFHQGLARDTARKVAARQGHAAVTALFDAIPSGRARTPARGGAAPVGVPVL